ncbi:beta clamp domain-containing protein [Paenibacillus cucumis (ex Kampfer et al. 2016)]|uniref:DNA polymerase III beta sliding clamp C-terminal domain-containing protein n=1 Tax=Paenibacillus cucumis (ex Kampfer et al. 2016) TaxID=1776858 RepID=A0ABS7KCZ5_9BACL|nr:hypothetical protein [Paenibacillus cucumis (ex Kampfer et al. 2016)]MBY0202007.1 hypothetical protein [Paenibacillus cucumis (ex Kampfer et al. 2016)]
MNKQEMLVKYGKKFAAPPKIGGVLEGVHYTTDGTAYVTNRHVALIIRDIHHLEEPITLHPKTEEPIQGAYPDVSQLIPTTFSQEITISAGIKNVLVRVAAADGVATSINKKNPLAEIEANNGIASLKVNSPKHVIQFSTVLGSTEESFQIGVNTEHLSLAFSVFADMKAEQVYVKFGGGRGPIVITNDEDIEVLLLPSPLNEQRDCSE